MVEMSPKPPTGANITIHCDCQNFENNECHVVSLVLKRFNLPGILPPQLVKLLYLQVVDLAYNYLSGEIPREWAALKLQWISLSVNRLSGEIPKFLGSMTSLRYLSLEANQFSGTLPAELGISLSHVAESLGQLNSLRIQNLNGNKLSGRVSAALGGRLLHRASFNFTDNNGLCGIPGLPTCGPHLSAGAKLDIAFASCIALLVVLCAIVWWKRQQNILRTQKIAARARKAAPYASKRTQFSRDVQMTIQPRTASESGPSLLS